MAFSIDDPPELLGRDQTITVAYQFRNLVPVDLRAIEIEPDHPRGPTKAGMKNEETANVESWFLCSSYSRDRPQKTEVAMMFQEAFPILTVSDMQKALDFYRDQLEFVETYRFPEQGEPVYVGLELGASRLGIGVDPKLASSNERDTELDRPFDLWVYADDCDAAIERLRTKGVQITEEPAEQPWGERIARVMDPDGNRVIVATRAD